MKKLKILFIGGGYPSHFYRLASHLYQYDEGIQIDWLTTAKVPNDVVKSDGFPITILYNIKKHFFGICYKLPILSSLCSIIDFKKSINNYSIAGYDIISIQYVTSLYLFNLRDIKRMGEKLVLSPWGSDVFRINCLEKRLLRRLYTSADYVTLLTKDFGGFIIKSFGISQEKCVYLDYGSDPIDTIISNIDIISKNEAKAQLGIPNDSYTITCGTNSSPAQRHVKIIEELVKAKSQLPSNVVIMVMLGRTTKEYDNSVLKKLEDSHFKYIYFDRRLSEWEMFLWRRATDMLIHAQVSDSNSVSIQEAMLCDSIIVNGDWMRYPHHEKYGIPYYLFHSFEDLSGVVIEAIQSPTIQVSKSLKEDINKMAWSYLIKDWADFFWTLKKTK